VRKVLFYEKGAFLPKLANSSLVNLPPVQWASSFDR